jgi:hypothetical protein
MFELVLFALASVGMTAILVDGAIFERPRQWLFQRYCPTARFLTGILTCYQCCGFWCGLFCGTVLFHHTLSLPKLLLCGFAGSVLAHLFLQVFEAVFYLKEFLRGRQDKE